MKLYVCLSCTGWPLSIWRVKWSDGKIRKLFLREEFKIGSTEIFNFIVIVAHMTKNDSGTFTNNGTDKMIQIQPYWQGQRGKRDRGRNATEKEITAYRSVIGKIHYKERLASTSIAFHATDVATNCSDFRLCHFRALYAVLISVQISRVLSQFYHQPFQVSISK